MVGHIDAYDELAAALKKLDKSKERNGMKKIEKKVLPEYYKEIRSHRKMFELRKDDSDYEVGDILILREWDGEKYTGGRTRREITYILRNCPEYGLMDGYCILSLQTPGWDSFLRPPTVTLAGLKWCELFYAMKEKVTEDDTGRSDGIQKECSV